MKSSILAAGVSAIVLAGCTTANQAPIINRDFPPIVPNEASPEREVFLPPEKAQIIYKYLLEEFHCALAVPESVEEGVSPVPRLLGAWPQECRIEKKPERTPT